jgi:hypothetical protein
MNGWLSVLNTASQVGSAMGQRYENKKVASRNRRWADEDLDDQRAYDHPKAVMQRLKEAKLNPLLVYGSQSIQGSSGKKQPTPMQAPEVNFDFNPLNIKQQILTNKNLSEEGKIKEMQKQQLALDFEKSKYDFNIAKNRGIKTTENSLLSANLGGLSDTGKRVGTNPRTLGLVGNIARYVRSKISYSKSSKKGKQIYQQRTSKNVPIEVY